MNATIIETTETGVITDGGVAKFALLESDFEPVSLFIYDADDEEVIAGGDY